MRLRELWTVAALVAAGFALPGLTADVALAVDADRPARVEEISGSKVKRVILTQKAFERLAIATASVREEPLMRWLMVESEVEKSTLAEPAAIQSDTTAAKGEEGPLRLRVPVPDTRAQGLGRAVLVLALGALEKDADDDKGEADDEDDLKADPNDGFKLDIEPNRPMTVLVVPIGGERGPVRLRATPIEVVPGKDADAKYFALNDTDHPLRAGQRVFVRVTQPDSGKLQKVIPYAAVIYDAAGNSWTYTNPEPLVFVRHPIVIEYIDGDLAALKEGPEVGTAVVTVGAPELMGVELNVGH